ncbi:hypothetical protein [Pseudomonas sp. R4-75]|uniref:hypothetical protein n=1 Tax=Pseudomonas sp. R4-75 TaxID=2817404 RepID=UPI003DA825EA
MTDADRDKVEDKEKTEHLYQTAEQYYAMVKAHRRQQRAIRFRQMNPLAWYFDELPAQDMYKSSLANQRSTRQEVRYHWLRQRTGWIFWSQLKTTTAVRFAAFGGLMSAFYQAAPGLHGDAGDAAAPLRWLLLAGMTYLLAVLWYEILVSSPVETGDFLKARSSRASIERLASYLGRRRTTTMVEQARLVATS